MESLSLPAESIAAWRIILLVLWVLLRCFNAKTHLQAFLNTPLAKLPELQQNPQLKYDDRRKRVRYYALYFCAASLQYYLPAFIILSVGLLSKSFG